MNQPEKNTQPVLAVEGLSISFHTPKGLMKVVDNVSFEVYAGETLGIVGESGSGKSVTSRSIMRLLSERTALVEGTIRFNGEDISDFSNDQMRSIWGTGMAMIFQNPMTSLNPVMKIGKQIAQGLRIHQGMNKKDARQEAIRLMNEVGIPEADRRVDNYPHQFSGGLRQRATIAIALASNPTLIVADEPTTSLDVTIQAQILNLLKREQEQRGMAMILVTHDFGVVAGRTDRTAVMYAGQIVEQARTTDLFDHPRMPYTRALLDSIPSVDDPPHKALHVIEGRPPNPQEFPSGCRFHPRCPRSTEICLNKTPVLEADLHATHEFACWHPIEISQKERK